MADILIVDDDADVCWVLQQLLTLHGHVIRTAADGEEGIRLLIERPPDLLLLDIEMPVLDGPSMAYRMLVHNCGLEQIPIVLISGSLSLESVAERVGTSYRLSKPFQPEVMLALVERALTERRPPEPPTA